MQIAVLGPLVVLDAAGQPVDVAGARLRTLLVRLALDAGRPVGTAALVDVRIAVLSGGVTQVGEVLFEPLRRHLAGHAGLSYIRDISVVPSPLRRSACLLGAARLAFAARPDLAG